ncbi:hypothetical protein QQX09_12175 [Demequina sp. SYSU T00192]|uniref:Uncharacterized protein n=1 Tax=Demequina litoralis TaxID=3051660 RepID=A0ABT8GD60_9MICO|nr:hypothetical protein [Demequina sp. SYSU T00192]MDN4476614.1 hypothetical protein [Demequina sp. SYSU T00192]
MTHRKPLDTYDRDELLARGFSPEPSPEPAPEAVDAAVAAIVARPEADLPEAATRALLAALRAAQEAGATSAAQADTMRAYIGARERLEAEDAIARLLP